MSVGKVGPFDMNKDCWDLYIERLEQYFIANDVKEAVKVATLITVIGADAYELMVNLCTPARPSTKKFDELVKIMKSHLQPKPSVLAERYKFRQRRQATNESIAEYVAGLKKMSMTCNFVEQRLSENLRDQLVCGLTKDSIRQRLFAEDDVSFEKACKLAMTMEAAEADAAVVENQVARQTGNMTVYQMSSDANRRASGSRAWEERKGIDGRRESRQTAGDKTGRGGSARGARPAPTAAGTSGGGRQQRAPAGCAACGGQHDTKDVPAVA
ncbi:uncharacterized protein [Choristoneura fumiferana]|uniref:uncharacterized protein n=1 Tax=Choristoneura fumiferana TaxID=7141 RepID=UPI003D15BD16